MGKYWTIDCRVGFHSITSDPRVRVWGGVEHLSLGGGGGGSERTPLFFFKDLCQGERIF